MPPEAEVAIVDYGMGNLFNLQKAIAYLGGHSVLALDPETVKTARRVILPGVGAFEDGIGRLRQKGMPAALRDFLASGRPLLGICLGMQLLMDESQEGGSHPGLGFVRGRVTRFLPPVPGEEAYKIPHIGWNSFNVPAHLSDWQGTLLGDVRPGDDVYFVHSYTVCPADEQAVLARTRYGRQDFCSALRQGNIYGCQFHPEVSGPVGLKILKRFIFD